MFQTSLVILLSASLQKSTVRRLFCQTNEFARNNYSAHKYVPKGCYWCTNINYFGEKMVDQALDHDIDLQRCLFRNLENEFSLNQQTFPTNISSKVKKIANLCLVTKHLENTMFIILSGVVTTFSNFCASHLSH